MRAVALLVCSLAAIVVACGRAGGADIAPDPAKSSHATTSPPVAADDVEHRTLDGAVGDWFRVRIDADSSVHLATGVAVAFDELERRARVARITHPGLRGLVTPHSETPAGTVKRVVQTLMRAGIVDLDFATQ